jgi:hypothetical protein
LLYFVRLRIAVFAFIDLSRAIAPLQPPIDAKMYRDTNYIKNNNI